MGRIVSIFKFWILILCLVFLLGIPYAQGLNCYSCIEMDEDVRSRSFFSEKDMCSYKVAHGLVSKCDPTSNVCLKITAGYGEHVSLACGKVRGDEFDECKSELEPLVDSKNDTSTIPPQHTIICMCTTDGCNTATMVYPFSALTIWIIAIAGML